MWIKNSIFFLFAAVIISSCSSSKSTNPNSTGRASEIIVVCSPGKWSGPVGDTVRGVLKQIMPGLPVEEPEFTLLNIPPDNFGKILNTHRNILIIEMGEEYTKSRVETLTNVWSHPQRIVKIKAASDTAFINIFARHAEAIRELYNRNERARFSAQNALNRNSAVEKLLSDHFGIDMVISKDFYKAKLTKDFLWLRYETTAMSLGLMIYTYPYKDTAQINPGAVLSTRDRYTRLYIPGPLEGSYMVTDQKNYKPASGTLLFKNMFAVETRGLWRTEGDFMGGSFINYSIVDAPRQRIVVFDGYVYNPNSPKRDFIRQLESIIWGAEFRNPAINYTK